MERKRYVYWQEEDMWIGYFEEYPDYKTQGESLNELKENLKDIYNELTSGNIPCVRRVTELEGYFRGQTGFCHQKLDNQAYTQSITLRSGIL